MEEFVEEVDWEGEPLIELEEGTEAANDEWAYQQADRLVRKLPGRIGHDRKTESEVFDHQTLMTLHRLLTHGVLKSLDFPVSTGKEANVFRGTTPMGGHVAVKIYRVNTSTFKHVLQYIQGDDRFQGVTGDKRSLVHAWAQKEYRNMLRIRDVGVDVPEPIKVLQNVLVMEYLGLPQGPWPRLKSLGRVEKEDAQAFWAKLVEDYAAIHNKAGLVHADFSEYNILVERAGTKEARPRIIDVGQAVLKNHPMAWEFRDRDLRNLVAYFRRMRLDVQESDVKARLEVPE